MKQAIKHQDGNIVIWGVLALLLIIAVFIGIKFYLSLTRIDAINDVWPPLSSPEPSQNPTADWKLYTSTCGFTLKYPPTWMVAPPLIKSNCGTLLGPNRILEPQTGALKSGLNISINKANLKIGDAYEIQMQGGSSEVRINTLDDYINTLGSDWDCQSPSHIQDKTYGNIQGKLFLSAQDSCTEKDNIYYIFAFNHNEIFQITWPKEEVADYDKDIQVILNSIEFTDQSQVIKQTSNLLY